MGGTFENVFGSYYKFKEWEFWNAACEDDDRSSSSANADDGNDGGGGGLLNRTKFRNAINQVCKSLKCNNSDGDNEGSSSSMMMSSSTTTNIRNVEMLTLGTNEAGLPVRRYFDWTIGSVQLDNNEDHINMGSGGGPSEAVILYGNLVNEIESTNR